MNKKNITKKVLENAKLIVLAVLLTLGLSYVSATWTAPTAPPVGNNAEAPINVSSGNQAKGGPSLGNSLLDINGLFSSQNIISFHDITGNNLSQANNSNVTYTGGIAGVCTTTSGKLVACDRTSGGSTGPSGNSGYILCRHTGPGFNVYGGYCHLFANGTEKTIATGLGIVNGERLILGQTYTLATTTPPITTSTNNVIIPPQVTDLKIEVQAGGGGGGARSCAPDDGGGGGGGGGGYYSATFSISKMHRLDIHIPSTSQTVTANNGEAGGCNGSNFFNAKNGDYAKVDFFSPNQTSQLNPDPGYYVAADEPYAIGGIGGEAEDAPGIPDGGLGGGSQGGGINGISLAGEDGQPGQNINFGGICGGTGGAGGNSSIIGLGAGGVGGGGNNGNCLTVPGDGQTGWVKISWTY
jgi:hypothetical protein